MSDFWEVMEKTGCDFTNGFRLLSGLTKSTSMTEKDEAVLNELV